MATLAREHSQQLAQAVGEQQQFFYWLRRRMIEWGFPESDETLSMIAEIDDSIGELRSRLYFLGYDEDAKCWR